MSATQRCAKRGCGHDISSHHSEKAVSETTGEIKTLYFDCLAMFCTCRGYVPEPPAPYEPDDD